MHDRLLCEPTSEHVFLFSNAQRNRLALILRVSGTVEFFAAIDIMVRGIVHSHSRRVKIEPSTFHILISKIVNKSDMGNEELLWLHGRRGNQNWHAVSAVLFDGAPCASCGTAQ